MKTEQSKCDDTFTFRLPGHTKAAFKKLTITQKHEAEYKLRIVIAKAIHEARFVESHYLGDEEE